MSPQNTMIRVQDIKIGSRFTRLTVVGVFPVKPVRWRCLCVCGNERSVSTQALREGLSRSCGCIQGDKWTPRHLIGTPEYKTWRGIKKRCYDTHSKRYCDYGGSGIRVHEEWKGSFVAFLSYVGVKPGPEYSIDRYPDPYGNYEPGNVRWATRMEQAANKRPRGWRSIGAYI